jgi:Signal peptidase, peptidase S26
MNTLNSAQPAELSNQTLQRLARSVATTTAAIVLLITLRLSCIDGLMRRVTIDGPSMAPAFRGQSYLVTCADCEFPFRCDAEHLPVDGRAACPNCGFIDNPIATADLFSAEAVLIDRWPGWWRPLRRGDVVACRVSAGELAVKRIVGLPGERLAIQQGDVYDGKKLIRKTPVELRKVWQLVHDNDYQPRKTPDLPPRWQGSEAGSGWQADGLGFKVEAAVTRRNSHHWLEYVHWPGTQAGQRSLPSAISDSDSFNQGETHRPLNAVSDVLLSCRLRSTGTGGFAFAADDGQERFEVHVESNRQVTLCCGNRILLTRPLTTHFSKKFSQLEFGLCDQQVLFAVDGLLVFSYAYDRPDGARPDVLHPLAIGARGVGLHVDRLRVWRDAYYLDPDGLSRPWESPSPLADDAFGLLGDNQPVSIDSRHWEPPGIQRRAILGVVYKPFWRLSR